MQEGTVTIWISLAACRPLKPGDKILVTSSTMWTCKCTLVNEAGSSRCAACCCPHPDFGTFRQCHLCLRFSPVSRDTCLECGIDLLRLDDSDRAVPDIQHSDTSTWDDTRNIPVANAFPHYRPERPYDYEDEEQFGFVASGGSNLKRSDGGEMRATTGIVDDEVLEFRDQECRLVLVGKTGSGKSSTGNTILGMEIFQQGNSFQSITEKCQRHNTVRFGIRLEVVDTPGLFDTNKDQSTIAEEIVKCFGILSPGPHAIVLVIRMDVRLTEEENKVIEKLDEIFSKQLVHFLVIAFTHGDILAGHEEGGQDTSLDKILTTMTGKIKDLLDRTQNRFVVLNNRASRAAKDEQVRKLIRIIGKMGTANGGIYTSQLFERVEDRMQKREDELLENVRGGVGGEQGNRTEVKVDPFQCREMARDEIVNEGPLMDVIKELVITSILPLLEKLVQMLLSKGLKWLAGTGYCNLM